MNRLLKARIIERYGTQSDFAAFIKADETLISRVVRNRRLLSWKDQRRWAVALGCKVSELFGNKPNMDSRTEEDKTGSWRRS